MQTLKLLPLALSVVSILTLPPERQPYRSGLIRYR